MVPENKFQMICLRGTSVIEQKAEISIIDKSRDITPQRKKNQYPTQLASYAQLYSQQYDFCHTGRFTDLYVLDPKVSSCLYIHPTFDFC
jgi:hypothetical protein